LYPQTAGRDPRSRPGCADPGSASTATWGRVLATLALLWAVTGCAAASPHTETPAIGATPALDLKALSDLDTLIDRLADTRVVFVGEQHDRYEHHLTQLEIIRRLHAQHPELAIGMEAFQQPFQSYLDAYVAGELSETELLRNTEYYSRWGMDFRLYAPILRYAREQRLPVVALNLPREITRQVGRGGMESLSAQDRAQLPAEIDRSDAEYERRLLDIYDGHSHDNGQSFERFLQVQLLWDEGMAQRAADYLTAHPGQRLVVLAGNGHLAYGSGIPQRLLRRQPVSSAIVLNGWQGGIEPRLADFLLFPAAQSLPPSARLGALLSEKGDHLSVALCQPGSPCQTAGLKPGDRVVSIDGQAINGMVDLQLALWGKHPGDRVTLGISRKRWVFPRKTLSLEVELRAIE
jgi:uncharacterized iron-regulated protein